MSSVPLEELADVTMGQSPDSNLVGTGDQGLPFLQGSAEFGRISPTSVLRCAQPPRKAKGGSILISVRAPVGEMNGADQDYCIGRGLGAFTAKAGIANTIFLKHAVEQNLPWLHRRSQGSTFAAISADDLRSLPIPGLALQRQDEIATVFAAVDAAIEGAEALIEKYQQIKAGLMLDLFTRGVLPDGRLRPKPSEDSALYLQSEASCIPKDWQASTLQAQINPARPIAYGILMPGYGFAGGVPVVKVKDIRNRRIGVDGLLLTSPQLDHEYRRSRLRPGDILFTIRGTVGRVALVPPELDGANITQDTARIDLLNSSNRFLSYFLETPVARRFFEINTLGVAVQGINLGELRKLPIPIPPLDEQERIAERMDAAGARLDGEVAALCKLHAQKLGLMQDLLTGRVSVIVAVAATELSHA